jgi:hypothetical protein
MKRLILAVVALVSVGCERTPATVPDVTRTPTPLDHATTGAIVGAVRFSGVPPAPRAVSVTSDPACVARHPDGLTIADVRVADGRLADVFVYVAAGLEDRVFAVPETPVRIDQIGCLFVPRVAGAQAGQPIEFRTQDDTLHNVHGEPQVSPRWNFGLARPGAERTLRLDGPDVMVPVRCDVHPWMRLDLGVVPHPYFTVTGDDGAFRLADVPPGTYTVAAWHPKLGRREQTVLVRPHADAAIRFEFTAEP